MSPQKRAKIFAIFAQCTPHPKTELVYHSPFELLIAVLLSAQTTDKAVNRVTPGLFQQAPHPADMIALGEVNIRRAIASIGLYRTKAKNIVLLCQILLSRYRGLVPRTRRGLESLPGVGRKTANVVLNILYQKPVIPVDTHVLRVANRTQLATGHSTSVIEKKLTRAVPKAFRLYAHHWLVLHGRYVCKARRPECWRCCIAPLCGYPNKEEAIIR